MTQHKNDKKEEKTTMTQGFFRACLLILGGIILLYLALQMLSRFWGWLILIAIIIGAVWAAIAFVRSRRDRW